MEQKAQSRSIGNRSGSRPKRSFCNCHQRSATPNIQKRLHPGHSSQHRQPHSNRRAFTTLTFHFDFAAIQIDTALHNHQAKARPRTVSDILPPMEAVKSCSRSASGIPIPRLRMAQNSSSPEHPISNWTVRPMFEYLIGLVSKVVKTCRSKRSSASISEGISKNDRLHPITGSFVPFTFLRRRTTK